MKNGDYKVIPVEAVTFTFIIMEGNAPKLKAKNPNIKFQTYYKKDLPVFIDPNEYGILENHDNNTYVITGENNTILIIERVIISINGIDCKCNLVKFFKTTGNKRELLYNKNNQLINTKPLNINL